MKQAIIALVLIAVGSWLAHLHVASQTYYPVVRLTSSDGLVYTTVQDDLQERRACGAANERFLKPIKEACKQCQVVFAPGLRIAIAGPAPAAKASCEYIAGDMVKRGQRTAACVFPRS